MTCGSPRGRSGGGTGPGGMAARKRSGRRGPVSREKLSPPQRARLEAELRKGPLAGGFAHDQRWTLGRVKTLTGRLFHVGYTVEGTSKLLRRPGPHHQAQPQEDPVPPLPDQRLPGRHRPENRTLVIPCTTSAFCGFPGVLLSRWPLRACCYRRGSADAARSRATDPAATRADPAAILGLRRCTARAARRT